MRALRRLCALAAALLLLASTPLKAGLADGATLPWRSYTLAVDSIRVNPDNVSENPDPATTQYVLIRLESTGGLIPVAELIENVDDFRMTDADGTEYEKNAFMPYMMAYNDRARVFMTAMEQNKFDIFFVLPISVDLSGCTLYAGDSTLSLADGDIAALIMVQ